MYHHHPCMVQCLLHWHFPCIVQCSLHRHVDYCDLELGSSWWSLVTLLPLLWESSSQPSIMHRARMSTSITINSFIRCPMTINNVVTLSKHSYNVCISLSKHWEIWFTNTSVPLLRNYHMHSLGSCRTIERKVTVTKKPRACKLGTYTSFAPRQSQAFPSSIILWYTEKDSITRSVYSVYRLEQNIVMHMWLMYFIFSFRKFADRHLKLHNVQMHYIATNCMWTETNDGVWISCSTIIY